MIEFLRSIYTDDMHFEPWCKPPREELIRWSAQCMQELAFAERVGSQAHCYVRGGMPALENIRQFASYAAIQLERLE